MIMNEYSLELVLFVLWYFLDLVLIRWQPLLRDSDLVEPVEFYSAFFCKTFSHKCLINELFYVIFRMEISFSVLL